MHFGKSNRGRTNIVNSKRRKIVGTKRRREMLRLEPISMKGGPRKNEG